MGTKTARSWILVLFLLGAALTLGWMSGAYAGQGQSWPVKSYEGQIKSIKIDKCGVEPATCEGSIVLAKKGGGEVTLALKPGSWIKRGDQFVSMQELTVGSYVQAQAAELPREPQPRLSTLSLP
jgi:hypothetical protein